MALFRSIGARKDATRGTTAQEVRKGLEGLFTQPGVIPGGSSPLVAGHSTMAYTVNAAHFVTKRAAGDGIHLFGNDGAVQVGATGVGSTVPAAPGAGLSRIDIVWVRSRSNTENADATSEPDFGVTSGTAAASPVAPSIPAGALELARNTMTSAATTTASAGNTISQTAPVAYLRGAEPDAAPSAVAITALTGYGALAGYGTAKATVGLDGVVRLSGGFLRTAATAAGVTTFSVGTVPAAARPTGSKSRIAAVATQTGCPTLTIAHTTGTLTLDYPAATTVTQNVWWVSFDGVTYHVAEPV